MKPCKKSLSYVVLAAFLAIQLTLGAADIAALKPEPQSAEWAQSWWMPRHEAKLAEIERDPDRIQLVFIGDSITHGWETKGQSIWNEHYKPYNALNLGFSGDRTEQVLWRLQHGEVEGLSPKVVVLMIGTNNTGHRQDPAKDTAAGIQAILRELEQRLPRSKVLLLAIFPRAAEKTDALRQLNGRINQQIAQFADNERVFFLDINDTFLGEEGVLPTAIMPDLLHPNEEGYRIWAKAMDPKLKQLLGE